VKDQLENCEADVLQSKSSGSRDAVESAIDISKGNRLITWERALEEFTRISTWQAPHDARAKDKD